MKKKMLDENLLQISEKADRILTDQAQASTLLCYVLYRVEQPIDTELLYDIAVTGGIINYFTYQEAMQALEQAGAVVMQAGADGETVIHLTASGVEYAKRLKTIAAKSYRDQIVTAARKAVSRKRMQKEVNIAYEPHESGIHLHVTLHDGSLTLLEIRLFTPDQHQAEQMADRILANPSNLYHQVIQAVMQEQDERIDLTDN